MEKARQFHTYTDFLQDEDFILWVLTRDEALGQYWKDFLKAHPENVEEFGKAVEHSAGIRLNQARLSAGEQELLRKRIHTSLGGMRRRRTLRRIAWYSMAICIALVVGAMVYMYRSDRPGDQIRTEKTAAIVWQALHPQDVHLVSGNKTTSLGQDAHLLISEDGTARIFNADTQKQEDIDIRKNEVNELVVPYGKRSRIELEDGTAIWLNSGSVLKFPTHFSNNIREVTLVGEMYAEVSTDSTRPFIVHTPGFDVKVYGTIFNISAYEEDEAPSCVLVEGHVGVRLDSCSDEIGLEPGERVVCNKKQLLKGKVDATRYTSWRNGYLVLDETDIVEVLNRIGRYYNLSFNFGDKTQLAGKKCSGKIYLSENVDNVLTTISLLYSTEYRKEKRTIFITENP